MVDETCLIIRKGSSRLEVGLGGAQDLAQELESITWHGCMCQIKVLRVNVRREKKKASPAQIPETGFETPGLPWVWNQFFVIQMIKVL